jgi:hypothetical protein
MTREGFPSKVTSKGMKTESRWEQELHPIKMESNCTPTACKHILTKKNCKFKPDQDKGEQLQQVHLLL